MYGNKYLSSCSALNLAVALYGHVSQPSDLSVFFLSEVVYILRCKTNTLVVWTVELYLSFLFCWWTILFDVL